MPWTSLRPAADAERFMREHLDTCLASKFECNKCSSFSSANKDKVRRHFNLCRGFRKNAKGLFVCTECQFTSKHLRYFHAHLKVHQQKAGLKFLKCKQCNYMTRSRGYLKRHGETKHGPPKTKRCIKDMNEKAGNKKKEPMKLRNSRKRKRIDSATEFTLSVFNNQLERFNQDVWLELAKTLHELCSRELSKNPPEAAQQVECHGMSFDSLHGCGAIHCASKTSRNWWREILANNSGRAEINCSTLTAEELSEFGAIVRAKVPGYLSQAAFPPRKIVRQLALINPGFKEEKVLILDTETIDGGGGRNISMKVTPEIQAFLRAQRFNLRFGSCRISFEES